MDTKQAALLEQCLQHAIDDEKIGGGRFSMEFWFDYNVPLVDVKDLDDRRTVNDNRWGVKGTSLVEIVNPLGACGTSACLAGTAVVLNGDTLVSFRGRHDDVFALTDDGRVETVYERGVELFGLSRSEASHLFYMTTSTLGEIVSYATKLALGYGHEIEVIW